MILVYYTVLRWSRTSQNIFLLAASLFFYAWGEPRFVLVMMMSIIINWAAGVFISSFEARGSEAGRKAALVTAIVFNLIIIFIFKYLVFTVTNIDAIFGAGLTVPEIALPIGISFFTFQAISYVVDVYRGKAGAQKNILYVGLYISFFPQLIAGPIVRYETVADQIMNRRETLDDFCDGVRRFIIGFCKKIIIANNVAIVADRAFELSSQGQLSVCMAWLGAIAYTLQIFYDFSGYSDMAIGLGRMFGFHFLENFDYPYISRSATEFWRRWHMSLGTWFRDYLYIPLGGSRVKTSARHIFNLFVVWLCTGIWHGANWTFILWGLMYFVLLVFEKYTGFNKLGGRGADHLKRVYVLFFIVMGWILFRADDLHSAAGYYRACFGAGAGAVDDAFIEYIRQYAFYIGAGMLFSTPVARWVKDKVKPNFFTDIVYAACLGALFIASISFLVKGSYNPFIYFNF